MLEDKLYTINELAKLTNLTDRTIRNYLANGNLTGIKVGGQWRFSKEDIKKFFSDSKFENDIRNKQERQMIDFYRKSNQNGAFITIKKVITDRDKLTKLFKEANQINKNETNKKVSFIEDDGNITITILGDFDYIIKILQIVKEY